MTADRKPGADHDKAVDTEESVPAHRVICQHLGGIEPGSINISKSMKSDDQKHGHDAKQFKIGITFFHNKYLSVA